MAKDKSGKGRSKKKKEENLRVRFLNHLKRRSYSGQTLNTYECLLSIYGRWLHSQGIENERRVVLQDLERFLVWLNTDHMMENAGSRANFVKALRSFYAFLCDERLILLNPTKDLLYPKIPKRVHRDVLTPEEVRELLQSPDMNTETGVRDQTVLRLFALCGLRISELAKLPVKNINIRNREILIRKGKGRKDRIVFCDHKTQGVLQVYINTIRPVLIRKKTDLMVIGEMGHAVGEICIRKIVKDHVKLSGIRKHVTPHSLRRTFAVLLLRGGCNLKAIAEIMGHDSLTTTAGYTQLDTTTLSEIYAHAHPLGGR